MPFQISIVYLLEGGVLWRVPCPLLSAACSELSELALIWMNGQMLASSSNATFISSSG
jgi:hypothetical protein